MKYKMTIIVSLLLLVTLTVFLQRADDEWEILNQEVMELQSAGKYDHALVVAQKALEIAEKNGGPNHLTVATSLNNLAELYRAKGQYPQAEPIYKRALKIREKTLGPDHSDVATSLNNLALLYKTQGYLTQAEPLYKRAVTILEKAMGPDHPLERV